MNITEIPSPTDTLTRHQQLERMQFMITLNGVELCALAQLTRKVGGMPDTTYRKYTQPFSDWFERQHFLYNSGNDRYFGTGVILACELPQ